MNFRECRITGTGSYLPSKVITNEAVSESTGLAAEDIIRMTGISERRRAGAEEAASDLATRAALSALEASQANAGDVDLIIVATTSPDMLMPATGCFVQKNINARNAAAFDINASCSGFLYALHTAEMFIKNNKADTALVISAEVKSRFVNPGDKETAILFGDGAGAVVLQGYNPPTSQIPLHPPFLKGEREGLIFTSLFTDGKNWDWIHLPAGGSRRPATHATISADLHTMRMDGSKIYKAAIRTLTAMVMDFVKQSGLRLEDIDHFIFHQANLRIIEQVIRRAGIPEEKVPLSLPSYGNTSSASIPITLDQAVRNGRIKEGDIVVLASFGGGLTWAISLVRW